MTGLPAAHAGPAREAGPASPAIRSQGQVPSDKIGVPVSMTASLSSVAAAGGAGVRQLASPCGILAGTVLRAARLSARLTQAQLAAAISADEATIAAWEDGLEPLATVPYPVVERLESALTGAGAGPGLVTDLTIAAWCDLVIAAIADSQDTRCLISDPVTAEEAFSELLTWSAGGCRPARYRPYAGPGPLLRQCDLDVMAAAIRKLGATRRFANPCAA
jgi:transcriptional regulator with XRE-family HTH domain